MNQSQNQSQNDCFYLLVRGTDGGNPRVIKIDRQGKLEIVDSTIDASATEQEIGMVDENRIVAVINKRNTRNTFLMAKGRVLNKEDFTKFLNGTNGEFLFQNKFNAFYKAKLKQKEEAEKLRQYKQDCNTRRLYLMVEGKIGVNKWTPIVMCKDSFSKISPATVTIVDNSPEHINELTEGIKPTQKIEISKKNDRYVLKNTAGQELFFKEVKALYDLDANQQKINDKYTDYMLSINEDDMNKRRRLVLKPSSFNKFDIARLDKERQEEERIEKAKQIKEKKNLQREKVLSKITMYDFRKKKQLSIDTEVEDPVKIAIKQARRQNSMTKMLNTNKEQILKTEGNKRFKKTIFATSGASDRNNPAIFLRQKFPKNITKHMDTRMLLPEQLKKLDKINKNQKEMFKEQLFLKRLNKDLFEKAKLGLNDGININIDEYNKKKGKLPNIGNGQGQ